MVPRTPPAVGFISENRAREDGWAPLRTMGSIGFAAGLGFTVKLVHGSENEWFWVLQNVGWPADAKRAAVLHIRIEHGAADCSMAQVLLDGAHAT
jgi:hypothetical protein